MLWLLTIEIFHITHSWILGIHNDFNRYFRKRSYYFPSFSFSLSLSLSLSSNTQVWYKCFDLFSSYGEENQNNFEPSLVKQHVRIILEKRAQKRGREMKGSSDDWTYMFIIVYNVQRIQWWVDFQGVMCAVF